MTARLIRFARLPSLMTGLVLLLALPAAGRSAEPSAKTFLESIYKSYVGSSQNEGVGIVLAKPETVKRYFTAGLASLMLEDNRATAGRDEPTTLDGDAFIGRQDWEIAALTVEVADNGPVKATGTVTYTNFGKPEKVVLDLLKVGDDWRIADIKYADGSLRALYIRK